MVKDRKGRDYSSSDDSSDGERRRKQKKRRSGSPEDYHRRQRHRHDHSPPDVKPRIKQESPSDSDSDSSSSTSDDSSPERKPRIKSEHDRHSDKHRHKHSSHSVKRKHGRHRHLDELDHRHGGVDRDHREGGGHHIERVRVKQEPDSEDEMRQQREERRVNDQRRMENRQRREQEERRNRPADDRERHHRHDERGERGRDHKEDRGRGRGRGRGGRGRGGGGRDGNDIPEHERYGRREEQAAGQTSAEPNQPKDAPNFELSGKLTEDTNTYKGVVIKYNEPAEARKPKKRWRLYPFKNDEPMKPFHMHRQSAFLLGRDRIVADIPIDHPSCSKQHAVFQYRMVQYEKHDGRKAFRIAPYIIDLESANGTFLNNKRIDDRVYVELKEKDVLKFGFSSREYVLLHDKSDTREVESDVSD